MMRIPDAPGRLELAMYHTPTAITSEPQTAPANTVGLHRVMFAVDDIQDTLARLRQHGAEIGLAMLIHLSKRIHHRSKYQGVYTYGVTPPDRQTPTS